MSKLFRIRILLWIAAVIAGMALLIWLIIPALNDSDDEEKESDSQARVADGAISQSDLQKTIDAAVEGTRERVGSVPEDVPVIDAEATIQAGIVGTQTYEAQVAGQIQTAVEGTRQVDAMTLTAAADHLETTAATASGLPAATVDFLPPSP